MCGLFEPRNAAVILSSRLSFFGGLPSVHEAGSPLQKNTHNPSIAQRAPVNVMVSMMPSCGMSAIHFHQLSADKTLRFDGFS
jgi:hypothetical protein